MPCVDCGFASLPNEHPLREPARASLVEAVSVFVGCEIGGIPPYRALAWTPEILGFQTTGNG